MKKLFKILAIFLIIFFFIYKCHEEVKNVNKYIGFDLEYRRFILNKLYFSKNLYFNPKEIIWDKIRLPLRLEKETTSWLDGKTAWEYHPDPLIFKAIAITYDLSDNDCIYSTENICSEELEESKKQIMKYYRKDQIIKYLRLYQDKYKSKPVLYHKFNHKLGRAKAQDALSMVYIMNNIRSTIWGDYYTDFDIENAHVVILSQILNGNYKCFYLNQYVKYRDNILKILVKKHKIDRKLAKQIILAILYGQINTQVKDTLFEKLIKERNGNKKKKK